jgi:HEAT repeat protein
LKGGFSGTRKASAIALGKIGGHRAIEALINSLGDPFFLVREAAAQELECFDEPMGRLILAVLEYSVEAVEALNELEDPRAVDVIIKTLGDKDVEVRKKAASTLEELDEPSGLLIYRAMDGSPTAMIELARINDHRAIVPLIDALQDRNSIVRRSAAQALGEIKDIRAIDGLVKSD